MQIEQGGVAVLFHEAAEVHGLRLTVQVVLVEAYDVEHRGIVVEDGFEGFLRDDGEHGSVLFVPVEQNARGEHHVAHGTEAYGHHVFVAYFGRVACHTDLPVELTVGENGFEGPSACGKRLPGRKISPEDILFLCKFQNLTRQQPECPGQRPPRSGEAREHPAFQSETGGNALKSGHVKA